MTQNTQAKRIQKRLHLMCIFAFILVAGCQSSKSEPSANATSSFPDADEVFALEIALTKAARACDFDKVRDLLRQGADPDGRIGLKARRYAFAHGWRGESPVSNIRATPLLALLAPHYEGDPLYETSEDEGLLAYRQADVALLLLSAGADPNLQDVNSFGDFPLLLAAETDNYHAIKALLECGAHVDMSAESFTQFDPTTSPSTALGYAIQNEATWTMELLLKAEASPLLGGHYYSPIERAARTGNPEVLGMLLHECEPWLDHYQGHWSSAMTKLIVAWGYVADDDDYDVEYDAPPFQASFEMLIDAGASLEPDRLDQDFLIFSVLDVNDIGLGKWFFEELAKIPEPNEEENAIQYLGSFIDADDLKKAFAMGVSPNDTDHLGRTMLHYAAIEDRIDSIAVLLKAGAKHDVKDKQGLTPLDVADEFVRDEFAELIQNQR